MSNDWDDTGPSVAEDAEKIIHRTFLDVLLQGALIDEPDHVHKLGQHLLTDGKYEQLGQLIGPRIWAYACRQARYERSLEQGVS